MIIDLLKNPKYNSWKSEWFLLILCIYLKQTVLKISFNLSSFVVFILNSDAQFFQIIIKKWLLPFDLLDILFVLLCGKILWLFEESFFISNSFLRLQLLKNEFKRNFVFFDPPFMQNEFDHRVVFLGVNLKMRFDL